VIRRSDSVQLLAAQLTSACCADFVPALEGRAVVNLQMKDTFAALQDINAAISVQPTAELLTNRGVIHEARCLYALTL